MNRYEVYKDSRVEWLAEIPAEWEVKKLKYLVSINDESLPETTDERFLIKYVDISNVKSGVGILSIEELSFSSAPSRARRIVREGDVIVSTVRTYLRSIARISNPPENLIASTGFAVIRPRKLNSGYTGYMFYSENLIGEIVSRSTGVSYPAISASEIGNISVPIPNTKEQTAIANFLDRKTAEIDALIAQKERLLELYEEEKTAIINHAVTKGLDPNVEFKDSGVDWLGEIPVGWGVKKLKYLLNFHDNQRIPLSADQRARMINKKYDYYGASGVIDQVEEYIFDGDYILLGEDGANLLTRSTALAFKASGKFWVNNHAHILSPKDGELNFFVHFLERVDYTIFVSGSAQPKLTAEALGTVDLIEPPKDQQTAIVQYIESEIARTDVKIAKTRRIIELQKEYRTSLISELVTGKIKVPELPTQEASA